MADFFKKFNDTAKSAWNSVQDYSRDISERTGRYPKAVQPVAQAGLVVGDIVRPWKEAIERGEQIRQKGLSASMKWLTSPSPRTGQINPPDTTVGKQRIRNIGNDQVDQWTRQQNIARNPQNPGMRSLQRGEGRLAREIRSERRTGDKQPQRASSEDVLAGIDRRTQGWKDVSDIYKSMRKSPNEVARDRLQNRMNSLEANAAYLRRSNRGDEAAAMEQTRSDLMDQWSKAVDQIGETDRTRMSADASRDVANIRGRFGLREADAQRQAGLQEAAYGAEAAKNLEDTKFNRKLTFEKLKNIWSNAQNQREFVQDSKMKLTEMLAENPGLLNEPIDPDMDLADWNKFSQAEKKQAFINRNINEFLQQPGQSGQSTEDDPNKFVTK